MKTIRIILLLSAVLFTGCEQPTQLIDFRVGTKLKNVKNPYYGFVKNNEKDFYHRQAIGFWVKLRNSDKPKMLKVYRIYPSGTKALIAQDKVPVSKKYLVWFMEVNVMAAKREQVVLQAELDGWYTRIEFEISQKMSPF